MRWIAATNRRAGGLPQTRSIAPHVERGRSWMAPEAKSEDLLYISDYYGVHVFSYPKGQYVGDIDAFGYGLCSDRAGDVFVTDAPAYQVYEYAHGSTKRLQTLYGNYVDFGPIDCSVDPTTGNLAVASSDSGFVVVFPKAEQNPKVYYDQTMLHASMFFCAYDDKGNLFVDSIYNRSHSHLYIGELPKGTKQFANYSTGLAHRASWRHPVRRKARSHRGSRIAHRLSASLLRL